jgi:hypothetical protein
MFLKCVLHFLEKIAEYNNVTKGISWGFFTFRTSLDLLIDLGQMSHLISSPCSNKLLHILEHVFS